MSEQVLPENHNIRQGSLHSNPVKEDRPVTEDSGIEERGDIEVPGPLPYRGPEAPMTSKSYIVPASLYPKPDWVSEAVRIKVERMRARRKTKKSDRSNSD